jgi:hypothetical protein
MSKMKGIHVEMMGIFSDSVAEIIEDVILGTPKDHVDDWEECALCHCEIFPGDSICMICESTVEERAAMEVDRG